MRAMFQYDSDKEDPTRESGERLLAEEEGTLWSGGDESSSDTCKAVATTLLQMSALGLLFLVGCVFGFYWRGDLNSLCSRHVSQYCEYTPVMLLKPSLLKSSSDCDERRWN
jgi:hypothetical protein